MSYFPKIAIVGNSEGILDAVVGSAIPANALQMGGSDGTDLRAIATDTSGNVKVLVVAGSAVIGHVITDTGSTTAVTGTVAISAASLPLPTGASTSAKQPALGTAGTASADVITVQGITSMTPLKVDGSGATQPVAGNKTNNNAAPDATNVGVLPAIANAAAPTYTEGDQVLSSTDLAGYTRVTLKSSGATAATAPTNAVQQGIRAATTIPTAVTDGQLVAPMSTKTGKAVIVLNSPRELRSSVSVQSTSASPATLIAAGASGVFNDIITLIFTNETSTATIVSLSDGTVIYKFALAGNGGISANFNSPLPATSTATAWTVSNSAAVNVDCVAVYETVK